MCQLPLPLCMYFRSYEQSLFDRIPNKIPDTIPDKRKSISLTFSPKYKFLQVKRKQTFGISLKTHKNYRKF